MAIDIALFVSKRLMPVALALLLLGAARLAHRAALSQAVQGAGATSEVRVTNGR